VWVSYGSGQGSGEVYIRFSGCAGGYVRQVGHCKMGGICNLFLYHEDINLH